MPTKQQKIDFKFVKQHMLDKGLRESSTKTYLSRIFNTLNKLFDKTELSVPYLKKNRNKIKDYIINSGTSANNRKVAIMSLSHLLSAYEIDTEYLIKPLKELSDEADAESLTNKNSQIVEQINEIDFELMKSKIETIEDSHNRLICACYSLIPPLRQQDWINLPVVNVKPKEEINHVNLRKKQLLIYEHKTSKIHGGKVIELPKRLIDEIKRYIADPAKKNTLLPFSSSAMSRRIQSVFGASSSLLRKAYVSKYTPYMSSQELLKLSNILGHKLSTEVISYKKNINVTPELLPDEAIPDSASEASVMSDASTQTE